MTRISILLCLFICMSLVGCATLPVVQEPLKREHRFDVSFDKLWPEVVTAITEGNNNINVIDKSSGIIVFTKQLNKNEVAEYSSDKPNQPPWPIGVMGAHYGAGDAKVTLNAKPIDEKTSSVIIVVQMKGELYSILSSSRGYLPDADVIQQINSNGKLEEYIFNSIEMRINKKEEAA